MSTQGGIVIVSELHADYNGTDLVIRDGSERQAEALRLLEEALEMLPALKPASAWVSSGHDAKVDRLGAKLRHVRSVVKQL